MRDANKTSRECHESIAEALRQCGWYKSAGGKPPVGAPGPDTSDGIECECAPVRDLKAAPTPP